MRNACTRNTAESNSTKESSQSITRDSFAIKRSPLISTEYKTIVATCPMIPTRSAPTMFLSASISSYRSYPRLSLFDGGGKGDFFMIPNHNQAADSCARSGRYQISSFFEQFEKTRCGRSQEEKMIIFKSLVFPRSSQKSQKKSFFLNYFSRPGSELCRNIFNNLMDALPTQIEFICNLPERRPGRTHLQNFGISIRISRWTRLQRAPLPAVNSLDGRCALFRKLIFSASLAHVSNPSSQCDIRIINNFDMHGGYIAIAFPCGELRKGFDIGIESSNIVHKPQISTAPGASRKQLTFNYLLRQNLTSGTRASKLSKSQGGNA